MIVFLITIVLLVAYSFLIHFYYMAWSNMLAFDHDILAGFVPTEKITIVVPARNEEAVIDRCIKSLLQQSYPRELLEIIIVDDHSTDQTAAIVARYRLQGVILLSLADVIHQQQIKSYKKRAISEAIKIASGALIVTTDADCTAKPVWIETIAALHAARKPVFIAAPVKINYKKNFLSVFQAMDFAILQGITAASVSKKFHNMCNGANLAYEKTAFQAIDGFNGIDEIASGDDMLLMKKISDRYPGGTAFLYSPAAIVQTDPAPTWPAFFQQRIRWASKAGKYRDVWISLVLLLVYFLNCVCFVLLAGSIWNTKWLLFFSIIVFYKTIIEWGFVKSVLTWFNMQKLLPLFPLFQPFHILYTVIAGLLGSFRKYKWKGRIVR